MRNFALLFRSCPVAILILLGSASQHIAAAPICADVFTGAVGGVGSSSVVELKKNSTIVTDSTVGESIHAGTLINSDKPQAKCDGGNCTKTATGTALTYTVSLGNGSTDLKVSGSKTLNSDAEFKKITVDKGGQLTLDGNITLKIKNEFTSEDQGSGWIKVNGNVVIYADTFKLAKNMHLTIASGASLTLYIKDELILSQNSTIDTAAEQENTFVAFANEVETEDQGGGTYDGIYYASKEIKVGKNASFTGSLASPEIIVEENATVTYMGNSKLNSAVIQGCQGSASIHHYEVTVPASNVTCLPSALTVKACADSSSPCTTVDSTVNGTATLATSVGTLGATSLTFVSGIATTTLSYPAAIEDAAATLSLSGESMAASSARSCCIGSTCAPSNTCVATFKTAGFIVSNGTTAAAATLPTQTAATASGTYYLRAVRKDTATAACVAGLPAGPHAVDWAYRCNNPSTCYVSNLMSINAGVATTVQGNNNTGTLSYTSVNMIFDSNGNAPFTFVYSDAGQVTLSAKKSINGALLVCESNAFVTKPGGFVLSNIRQTASPFLVNPGAAAATDAKFIKAGESFTLTVTAVTAGPSSTVTPNFGRENTPEGVKLTPTLLSPLGGSSGSIVDKGTPEGGSFNNGTATLTNLSWDEVGILKLTPSIKNAKYLGTDDVVGTSSGNIGRFYPARFSVTSPGFAAGCGTFTYMNQAFALSGTIQAQNLAGGKTSNYVGSFVKVTVQPKMENANNGVAVDVARLTGLGTPTWVAGEYNFVATGFSRSASPDGAYDDLDIGLQLVQAATDSDGSELINRDMAAESTGCVADTTGTSDGTCTAKRIANTKMRYGRMRLLNMYGSDKLPLGLPVQAQYWSSNSFLINSADTCTSVTVPAETTATP
ncbi:MAG: hypothetical protein K9K38_04170, partial [Rhodoferax sp.]|nr:hypothetical protein [Rhodoferax sp.]